MLIRDLIRRTPGEVLQRLGLSPADDAQAAMEKHKWNFLGGTGIEAMRLCQMDTDELRAILRSEHALLPLTLLVVVALLLDRGETL